MSEVLQREYVGLLEVADDFLEIYYGSVFLGWVEASGREPVFVADRGPKRARRHAEGGER